MQDAIHSIVDTATRGISLNPASTPGHGAAAKLSTASSCRHASCPSPDPSDLSQLPAEQYEGFLLRLETELLAELEHEQAVEQRLHDEAAALEAEAVDRAQEAELAEMLGSLQVHGP